MVALLAALWAGLSRLGWGLPPLQPGLSLAHGPLMVSGFLGTLIGVERAIALERRWTYLAPALSGLGGLLFAVGVPDPAPQLLMALGSAALVAVFGLIVRRQPALFTATMTLGAALWLAGNLLWLAGWPLYRVVPWWAGFLVLTIAGERLDLSRLLHLAPASVSLYLAALGVYLAGLALTLAAPAAGMRLAGAGSIFLALWLLAFDIARRRLRQPGLTRFIAISLLSGYVWLGVSGVLWLLAGNAVAGPLWDAMLHTVFVGFVFSMIFGHAPIIFPAVLGLPIPFRPAFYVPLALLHASLLLRVAGDIAGWLALRQWGGLLNEVALLGYVLVVVQAVRQGSRQQMSMASPKL
jgi:hypothetical protein